LKDNLTAQISQIPEIISVSQTDLNPIANTGTGFAPYFSSLALWIGALLISMVMGRRVERKQLQGANGVNLTIGRYLFFACAGILQAALLTGIIYALGIDVQSGFLTFLALVVSALTSIALVSTLIGIFGMFGQMLSMFLLIFQLTASGGTFPTELTQGGLFMALHPLVPFTYSLNALRETISGAPMNGKILAQSLAVQLAIALCAVIICAIIENLRGRKRTALAAIAA
ncbi:MAG: YhgE/Pip family protein, partial [Oscillospiraceae bacterium]|nr:YhgE/Pip family protein [Oscillospiraceae bacterium]